MKPTGEGRRPTPRDPPGCEDLESLDESDGRIALIQQRRDDGPVVPNPV
jgi:hypothetical protein